MIHRITVTDQTTPEDMDNFFSHAWRSENRVRLTFDVRHCRNISLKRAARMKGVLEKHRARSLKYIEESEILVPHRAAKMIIQAALVLFKAATPVRVTVG